MTSGRLAAVMQRLRRAALLDGGGLSDGDLLQRYVKDREDAAFAALVRRHGPMVLGVCRRILCNTHDADDAFQATFLVLVRKAPSILPPDRVGRWLYGVAYRTALKAKAMSSRRRAKQRPLEDMPARPAAVDAEWLVLLDREVNRLPEKYRAPIILCDLGGKTRKQAAKALGWPEGTVATRLQYARTILQKRLARQGLTLAAGALTLAWPRVLSAAVSSSLAAQVVQNASLVAVGTTIGLIPPRIIALVEGVLKAMVFTKVKAGFACVVIVSALGLGFGGLAGGGRFVVGAQSSAPTSSTDGAEPDVRAPADRLFVTAFVDSGTVQKNDARLPVGPAPIQALVSLDKGKVVVRTNQPAVVPNTIVDSQGRNLTYYQTVYTLRTDRFDREAVEICDAQGRKLNTRDLAKLLKEETPALLSVGSFDPLHLRFVKKETLVLTVPQSVGGLPPAVPATLSPRDAAITAPLPAPPPPVLPQSSSAPAQAEHDLAIARFYERTGHPGSAIFYYDLVCKRYPNTTPAETAARLLQELRQRGTLPPLQEKPIRIGQIIIVGNDYIPDAVIRGSLQLYPGQILNLKDLRAANERLNRLNKEGIDAFFSIQILNPDDGKSTRTSSYKCRRRLLAKL
jgi:RNA polymerase sigma factor (sigma-70 family)